MWPWGKDKEEATATAPPEADAGVEPRNLIRLQAQLSESPPAFLELPHNRRETPRERLRRMRTPSPRPLDSQAFFPTSEMDPESIRALVEATVKASKETAVNASLQAVRQQLEAQRLETPRPLTAAPTGEIRLVSRKPELPSFDKNNLEIWIKL